MAKYTPLAKWLKAQPRNSVVLTFGQVEEIISDKLPPSAEQRIEFWANWSNTAWVVDAGWKTVMVDLENKKVKFQ